ncbi:hypothetical protein CHELA41_24312 [Hyphomicrobiales bacterium]|nr:hypothetical protein CHELA41_24312 [Hyphomicrobiales bacterium]
MFSLARCPSAWGDSFSSMILARMAIAHADVSPASRSPSLPQASFFLSHVTSRSIGGTDDVSANIFFASRLAFFLLIVLTLTLAVTSDCAFGAR